MIFFVVDVIRETGIRKVGFFDPKKAFFPCFVLSCCCYFLLFETKEGHKTVRRSAALEQGNRIPSLARFEERIGAVLDEQVDDTSAVAKASIVERRHITVIKLVDRDTELEEHLGQIIVAFHGCDCDGVLLAFVHRKGVGAVLEEEVDSKMIALVDRKKQRVPAMVISSVYESVWCLPWCAIDRESLVVEGSHSRVKLGR